MNIQVVELTLLFQLVISKDNKTLYSLLEKRFERLPEFFLKKANDDNDQKIVQTIGGHFLCNEGFDEIADEAPLLIAVKKGYWNVAREIAENELSFSRTFEEKDVRGLTVLDYADIAGEKELRKHFEECYQRCKEDEER